MNLIERLRTLKSTWGLLGSASVFFPGAAYLLNLGSIKTSQLGSLYLATAVPLGALVLLIVVLLWYEPFVPDVRTLVLITTVLLSIAGLIGFIYFSTSKNDLVIEKGHTLCYGYTIDAEGNPARYGNGYKTEIHRKAGRVTELRKPCEYRDLEPSKNPYQLHKTETVWTGDEIETYIGMDSIEYYALIFFDLCFIALTASFTIISLWLKERELYNETELH
jgi:hypothetical protein